MNPDVIALRDQMLNNANDYEEFGPTRSYMTRFRPEFSSWALSIVHRLRLNDNFFNELLRKFLTLQKKNEPFVKPFMFYRICDRIMLHMRNPTEIIKDIVTLHKAALYEKNVILLHLVKIIDRKVSISEERIEEILDFLGISLIDEFKIEEKYHVDCHLALLVPITKATKNESLLARVTFTLARLQKEIDRGIMPNIQWELPNPSNHRIPWDIKIKILGLYRKAIDHNRIPTKFWLTNTNARFFVDMTPDEVGFYARHPDLQFFIAGYERAYVITADNCDTYPPRFYHVAHDIFTRQKDYTPQQSYNSTFFIANNILIYAQKFYEKDPDTSVQKNRPTKEIYKKRMFERFNAPNNNDTELFTKAMFVLHTNCIDLLKRYPVDTRVIHDFEYKLSQEEMYKILMFLFNSNMDLLRIPEKNNEYYPFPSNSAKFITEKMKFILAKNNFIMSAEIALDLILQIIWKNNRMAGKVFLNILASCELDIPWRKKPLIRILYAMVENKQIDVKYVIACYPNNTRVLKMLHFRNHLDYSGKNEPLQYLVPYWGTCCPPNPPGSALLAQGGLVE